MPKIKTYTHLTYTEILKRVAKAKTLNQLHKLRWDVIYYSGPGYKNARVLSAYSRKNYRLERKLKRK